ncbi:4-(cytidine 5'-diphospho)-2-C-methyl-D-erythritol kinase [Edaphobacter aggregans]|uniref:4-(cytidine 5'-diphospho)-2-C-methyl-D-erythritol kinase n=1 Tax=Edaphobacter aggregans TaxID=570835 RepID=UPI0005530598|nr:4-diphosphocytidyl-2C-methyl-D-erythritol kinase [Edaphobacter aggregans]
MSTRVRSYSKVNLGLAIGPVRPDGFHGLTTLYQTLELHDLVTVEAARAAETAITLTTNDGRVPTDGRNTCWKMVERALARLGVAAEVTVHIDKWLPVQGGMGAGSANAAAALIGLERELGVALGGAERLRLAGEVGSDVPLFLLGGSVLGLGRGEQVVPLPDMPSVFCVVAVPELGVSTPQAFRDWDALQQGVGGRGEGVGEVPEASCEPTSGGEAARYGAPGFVAPPENPGSLTQAGKPDRLYELSLAYASLYAEPGTSGIIRGSSPAGETADDQGGSDKHQGGQVDDLAENTLLALVRTGVENDFERVVFPAYPSLREIKRLLMGTGSEAAMYAALSGSGSALFGLYRSEADARAAQRRVLDARMDVGIKALMTKTLPRAEYWTRMFAG